MQRRLRSPSPRSARDQCQAEYDAARIPKERNLGKVMDRMGREDGHGSALRRHVRVLALVLAHKILVFGIIAVIVVGFPGSFSWRNSHANLLWPESARDTWREFFVTWDSSHYLRLAELGYRAGEMSSAFFPLWPIMIRGTAEATGLSAL